VRQLLVVIHAHTILLGRAFSAAGPQVWSNMLMDLRQPYVSISHFRLLPKTFLFGHWYHSTMWSRLVHV